MIKCISETTEANKEHINNSLIMILTVFLSTYIFEA